MTIAEERFHLAPQKLDGVIRSVQETHPEATEEDVRVVLLDELAGDDYQEWLDDAPVDELADHVRQHLENTLS